MNDKQIKDVLTAIGISSSVILIIFVVIGISMFYKNYLETRKLKLQIAFLQKTLATPGAVAQANPMESNYKKTVPGVTELKEYQKGLPVKHPYERFVM